MDAKAALLAIRTDPTCAREVLKDVPAVNLADWIAAALAGIVIDPESL